MTSSLREVFLYVENSTAIALLAKTTAALVLGLASAWLARRSRASIRHSILAVTFGALLLLPLASSFTPSVKIRVAVDASPVQTAPAITVLSTREPGSPISSTPAPSSRGLSGSSFLLAIWLSGAVIFLVPVVISLWQARTIRRNGVPWHDGQSLANDLIAEASVRSRVDVWLCENLSGPVTCGVFGPVILFPPDATQWNQEDLSRAIVHELEHVRRVDRVWHVSARILCAVYWFHPLVWMAWRHLTLEAEKACDDAVLARWETAEYADQLVLLGRRASSSLREARMLAMANRTDLAARIHAMLDHGQRRGRAGARAIMLSCGCAVLLIAAISAFRLVAAPQSATPAAGKTSEFQAVSVKLIDPASEGTHWHEHSDDTYVNITGSLHGFILRTYGIRETQLTGEPSWFNTRLYNIEAKTAAPVSAREMLLLLRGALTSRFNLKLREESRNMPVYSLEVAPRSPKLRELKPGEEAPQFPQPPPGVYGRTFTSVPELMNQLNGVFGGPPMADRPVVDRTQLSGSYVMRLDTERESQPDGSGNITPFPRLAGDLQSQLGLRLVADHQPMTAYVVEHVEAPSPN